ncbi:MAG: type II toxin-antitoxin system HicB family antitoxin [Candidatus Pristimantibacillus sp.]
MERYVFSALFETDEGVEGYTVSFPDLPGCHTEGDSLEEAYSMAKEVLRLHLYGMEEDGDVIPKPTSPNKLPAVKDGYYTLIEARTGLMRDKELNRSVSKNVTIPRWLELESTNAGLNFSQVLQYALKQHLGIQDKWK